MYININPKCIYSTFPAPLTALLWPLFPTDTVSKMLTIGPNSYLPVWVLDQHHYCYYSTDSSVFLTTISSQSQGNGAHMGKNRVYPWMGWQLNAGPYVSIWHFAQGHFCRALKVHLPLSPEHLPYFVHTETWTWKSDYDWNLIMMRCWGSKWATGTTLRCEWMKAEH